MESLITERRRHVQLCRLEGKPPLPFPWYNPEGEPTLDNRPCDFLEAQGVHTEGAWARECHCSSGSSPESIPFGAKAPLLRQLLRGSTGDVVVTREQLADQLADWWIVPGGVQLLTTAADVGLLLQGRSDLVATVRTMHFMLGGIIDPHASYLLLRGMKTLRLHVQHQNASALQLAQRLEAHPKVARVHYPGLASHPDHAVAAAQMSGYGGVVSFAVDGDLWRTAAFVDAVRLPYIAPSLGGVESLIEQPTVVSYWDQSPEERAQVGIKDNLIRFSTGIEDLEDIWADFEQAFDQI